MCAESLGMGHTGLLSSQVTGENRTIPVVSTMDVLTRARLPRMAGVCELLDLGRLLRLSSGSVLWVASWTRLLWCSGGMF